MQDLDEIFDKIIDVTEKIEDKATIAILMRAANHIILADQQYSLGETKGIDLTMLGLPDDRKEGRRICERRSNH